MKTLSKSKPISLLLLSNTCKNKKLRNQKQLLIEQLDNKLKPFSDAKTTIVPDSGWIKTIRTTINMTLEQLGGN